MSLLFQGILPDRLRFLIGVCNEMSSLAIVSQVQQAIKEAEAPTETELNAKAIVNLRCGPRNKIIVRGIVIDDGNDAGGDRSVSVVKPEPLAELEAEQSNGMY